jgi:hypothetical protein
MYPSQQEITLYNLSETRTINNAFIYYLITTKDFTNLLEILEIFPITFDDDLIIELVKKIPSIKFGLLIDILFENFILLNNNILDKFVNNIFDYNLYEKNVSYIINYYINSNIYQFIDWTKISASLDQSVSTLNASKLNQIKYFSKYLRQKINNQDENYKYFSDKINSINQYNLSFEEMIDEKNNNVKDYPFDNWNDLFIALKSNEISLSNKYSKLYLYNNLLNIISEMVNIKKISHDLSGGLNEYILYIINNTSLNDKLLNDNNIYKIIYLFIKNGAIPNILLLLEASKKEHDDIILTKNTNILLSAELKGDNYHPIYYNIRSNILDMIMYILIYTENINLINIFNDIENYTDWV